MNTNKKSTIKLYVYVILQLQAEWYAIPVNALQHTNPPNTEQVIQIAAAKFYLELFAQIATSVTIVI